jgi:hypothetical protein
MSLVSLLFLAGIFTLVLGLLHFFLPLMLDFRSVVQLTYGRRRGDWIILAYFGLLAALHLVVTIR